MIYIMDLITQKTKKIKHFEVFQQQLVIFKIQKYYFLLHSNLYEKDGSVAYNSTVKSPTGSLLSMNDGIICSNYLFLIYFSLIIFLS